VEIDDMGHHGGTKHAGGKIDSITIGEAGEECPFSRLGRWGRENTSSTM
jgi:hypothetical protein